MVDQSEAISGLEAKVRSLEIDKAVRDKHVEFLTDQNAAGQQNLLSQSRYIGHLETTVLSLGGKPNQQFLEAPIPKPDESHGMASPEGTDAPKAPYGPVH